MPANLTLTPLARIRADARVKTALAAAESEREGYLKTCAETAPIIHAEATRDGIGKLLSKSDSPGDIAKAVSASGADKRVLHAAAMRGCAIRRKAAVKLAEKVETLAKAGETVARELLAEAEAEERDFFARFALPSEATSASRRVIDLRAAIAEMVAGVWTPLNQVPGSTPLPKGIGQGVIEFLSE